MKINSFRGELTNISAKKEALLCNGLLTHVLRHTTMTRRVPNTSEFGGPPAYLICLGGPQI